LTRFVVAGTSKLNCLPFTTSCSYAARCIGSLRRECLDHIVALNERHVRGTVRSYVAYDNRTPTHLALGKDPPECRPAQGLNAGTITAFPEVVGCIIATNGVRRREPGRVGFSGGTALRRHHESATISMSLLRALQRDRCREPHPFSRVLGADSERRARVTATALATIEKPRSACAVYYNTACWPCGHLGLTENVAAPASGTHGVLWMDAAAN
jgi:hypothetical protein